MAVQEISVAFCHDSLPFGSAQSENQDTGKNSEEEEEEKLTVHVTESACK